MEYKINTNKKERKSLNKILNYRILNQLYAKDPPLTLFATVQAASLFKI